MYYHIFGTVKTQNRQLFFAFRLYIHFKYSFAEQTF